MKTCWTCKVALPLSEFYGSGKHAFNCRTCESARQKKIRQDTKNKKKEELAQGKIVSCRACSKNINYGNLAKTGTLANIVCLPCKRKYEHHKDPHNAAMVNGVCQRCEVYGKSDNCIGFRPSIRSWF